jgi:Gdp/GTP exchange factor required for growth at low temperatures
VQTNDQSTPQKWHLPPSTDGLCSETIAGANTDTKFARQSIASSADDGDANSFFDSSEEDYGNPISSGAAWFPAGRSLNSNDFVDMDEYLSSDEEGPSDAPAQLRKTARRLPHQRDLKFVSRIDSLSSRESPAAVTSVHSSVNVEEDDQSSVGHVTDPNSRKVFAWQLDYIIDSEEDEPRDVEAALRRLEGHVDRDRQHKKETKIDGWLRQVKQRKALQFTRADAADDDAVEVQSSKDGMESDDVLETPPDDSREMDGAQIEEHPLPPLPREMQGQREMDQVHPDLGRETITTVVEQHQSHPFPSVNASSMRRSSEEGAATIEWPESTVTHRAHKNSHSLSHRASFVKTSGARAHTTPLHESFVLMNRSLKIAQHLTAIESEIWRHIPIEDLLGIPPSVLDPSPPDDILDWGEYLKQRTGTNGVNINSSGRSLNGLVVARDRFWITAMWAASEILLTRSNLRPMLVSKFIRVALVSAMLGLP